MRARKKPAPSDEVQAILWDGEEATAASLLPVLGSYERENGNGNSRKLKKVKIYTPGGLSDLEIGEWVIIDSNNDYRILSAEVFDQNYDKILSDG